MSPLRRRGRFLLAVGLLAAGVSGVAAWVIRPRIVLHWVAPDGTVLVVYQEFSDLSEPFETSIFTRKPGQPWGWFYYDHQDLVWAAPRVDENAPDGTVSLWRSGMPVARYDWKRDQLTHFARQTTVEPLLKPNSHHGARYRARFEALMRSRLPHLAAAQ